MKQMQNIDTGLFVEALRKTTSLTLGQPFDAARSLYAMAVSLGLIKQSLLGCARFGRDIRALEKIALGPWAREV